ncbi:MAG TPA: hypothetical protein VFL76_03420 [Edaphocola sp.]|nr:hypothetical protein [Edaphocola sp.]
MDPLAAQGGQDMLSPYQAMRNNPGSLTDPGGMRPGGPGELKDAKLLQLVGPPGGAIVLTANAPIIPVNNDFGS